jgi:hypothetical protein
MRTFIIAVTCFSLGAGISHAKDIAAILGGIGKEPSKEETRAELQPTMDMLDVEGLHTLIVDYAHQVNVLQIKRDRDRSNRRKQSDIIKVLRAELKACEVK